MDLGHSRVALRERALLDVFDLAVRFCAAHARAYARLCPWVLVPAFAGSVAIAGAGGWWIGWSATVVFTAVAGAPFVALASRLVFSDDVGTRQALGAALRSLPLLLAARAAQALTLVLSALLLGLPWLWLGPIFVFAVEVLVLERPRGIGEALSRTRRIAAARFGTALATMLLLSAAPIVAAMVCDVAGREVLGEVLEIKPPPSMFTEGGSWLALLGWWATLPLISTARFFVYLDTRTRAEGWDIQTRFAAMAARGNASVPQSSRGSPPGVDRGPAQPETSRRATHAALLALALTSLALPSEARAAVDPSHAQSDVASTIAEHGYSFCRGPREPLSVRARAFCDRASDIPDCAGFAAACARAAESDGEHSRRWRFGDSAQLGGLAQAIAIVARTAVWVLVAAVVGAVLVPIVRAVARTPRRARRRDDDRKAAAASKEPVADDASPSDEESMLARADDLARRGQGAAALELYLAAALRSLDKRGVVRIAKDRTNGEYVRSCDDASARPVLERIVRDVDRVKFGGENATADVVARTASQAASLVRVLPMSLVAVALVCVLACGCSRPAAPRAGDDPGGDELWYAVLGRQGIPAERLDTALASLPLPAPGEQTPAVVVDAERTRLDAETRRHLVAWVDAGGVLVLAGAVDTWPREFDVASSRCDVTQASRVCRLVARESAEPAELSRCAGIECPETAERIAWFEGGATYAAIMPHGSGYVLGIATDELMTNVGLVRPGSAAAMVGIFSRTDSVSLRVAQEDDGVSPPSTPVAALSRAGLGIGLLHALAASLVLFAAVGVRLTRPRPSPPPRSRAFAEHVEAVGALYARTRAAPHALAAYARFAQERLRARMRGQHLAVGGMDIGAYLAARTRLPLDVCLRLWARAMAATEASALPRGDELEVLEELSAACTMALAEDT